MHRAIAIGDGYRVVVGYVGGLALLTFDRNRVPRDLTGYIGDGLRRREGLGAIRAAAQENVDRVPVAAGMPASFAVDQDGPLPGHHNAGNPIEFVAPFAALEKLGLGQKGRRSIGGKRQEHYGCEQPHLLFHDKYFTISISR